MKSINTVKDILLYAIDEKEKTTFLYKCISKKISTAKTKTILEQLSEEEIRHKHNLLSILDKHDFFVRISNLKNIEIPLIGAEPDYNLTEISVLLKFAINKEILSKKLYVNLAEYLPNCFMRNTILLIANEEEKHIKNLELELKSFN
ncbi:MAG: hypothetical protein Q8880_01820 [Bacteroidota bacterium]|nr:hypothetical protein [Bacteroidota bacterium]